MLVTGGQSPDVRRARTYSACSAEACCARFSRRGPGKTTGRGGQYQRVAVAFLQAAPTATRSRRSVAQRFWKAAPPPPTPSRPSSRSLPQRYNAVMRPGIRTFQGSGSRPKCPGIRTFQGSGSRPKCDDAQAGADLPSVAQRALRSSRSGFTRSEQHGFTGRAEPHLGVPGVWRTPFHCMCTVVPCALGSTEARSARAWMSGMPRPPFRRGEGG